MMPESDILSQHVRKVMMEIMAVLYANGFDSLHVGAAMRLLGVPDEAAQAFDQERLDLQSNLSEYLQLLGIEITDEVQAPLGATLH